MKVTSKLIKSYLMFVSLFQALRLWGRAKGEQGQRENVGVWGSSFSSQAPRLFSTRSSRRLPATNRKPEQAIPETARDESYLRSFYLNSHMKLVQKAINNHHHYHSFLMYSS